ncbi:MAG: hypothetical protein GXP26_00430 [Planctomycetes bacterium]|nr:hypothetical protein [Planctomycetota bacterium]
MAGDQPSVADTHTFLRLYSKNQMKIHSFLQMLLPDAGEAEEVMQQTNILLWEKWGKYNQDREFLAWACGVAKYQAYRHLREKKRQ